MIDDYIDKLNKLKAQEISGGLDHNLRYVFLKQHNYLDDVLFQHEEDVRLSLAGY